MINLKECPFCGSSDTQVHPQYGLTSCRKCPAKIDITRRWAHATPQQAADLWNTRTSVSKVKIQEIIDEHDDGIVFSGAVIDDLKQLIGDDS